MASALVVLVAFLLGGVVSYFVAVDTVGARMWRAGWQRGHDFALDDKARTDEIARQKALREIRKRKPKLTIVKGDEP